MLVMSHYKRHVYLHDNLYEQVDYNGISLCLLAIFALELAFTQYTFIMRTLYMMTICAGKCA